MKEDGTKLICLPYKDSGENQIDTIPISNFSIIECKIDADVYFHVLKDSNQSSYVILNGNRKVLERIECVSKKDDFYNTNKLSLSYRKCVLKSGKKSIRIDIFGKRLNRLIMHGSDFTCIDTIRSDASVLELFQLGSGIIIATVDVPILNIPVQYSYSYIIKGVADSCYIHNSEGGLNKELPPLNLQHLKYNKLFVQFEREGDLKRNVKLFVGKPEKIYYYFTIQNYSVYYQGSPEMISKNSYYFLLFPE